MLMYLNIYLSTHQPLPPFHILFSCLPVSKLLSVTIKGCELVVSTNKSDLEFLIYLSPPPKFEITLLCQCGQFMCGKFKTRPPCMRSKQCVN